MIIIKFLVCPNTNKNTVALHISFLYYNYQRYHCTYQYALFFDYYYITISYHKLACTWTVSSKCCQCCQVQILQTL